MQKFEKVNFMDCVFTINTKNPTLPPCAMQSACRLELQTAPLAGQTQKSKLGGARREISTLLKQKSQATVWLSWDTRKTVKTIKTYKTVNVGIARSRSLSGRWDRANTGTK